MSDHGQLQQLSAYLDGELAAHERASLESHLHGCAECSGVLAALRATVADLAALPEVDMDASAIAALDARLAIERRVGARGTKPRWAWASGAVAASVIAAIAFVAVGQRGPSRGPEVAQRLDSAAGSLAAQAVTTATDYTDASARSRLASLGPQADMPPLSAASAPRESGATPMSAPADAGQERYAADTGLSRCVSVVEGEGDSTPLLYEIARYKGVDAYLLYYLVPRDKPTRKEVWVVRRTDCFTLYFAQQKL